MQNAIYYFNIGVTETKISHLLQSKHSGCWSNILEKEARPCVLGGRRVVFQDEHLRKVLCYQVGKYFLTQKIYCHRFYCCCSIILPPSKKGSSRTVIGINVCSFGKCIFLGKLSYLAGVGYRFHWNILKTAYSTAALINSTVFLYIWKIKNIVIQAITGCNN